MNWEKPCASKFVFRLMTYQHGKDKFTFTVTVTNTGTITVTVTITDTVTSMVSRSSFNQRLITVEDPDFTRFLRVNA